MPTGEDFVRNPHLNEEDFQIGIPPPTEFLGRQEEKRDAEPGLGGFFKGFKTGLRIFKAFDNIKDTFEGDDKRKRSADPYVVSTKPWDGKFGPDVIDLKSFHPFGGPEKIKAVGGGRGLTKSKDKRDAEPLLDNLPVVGGLTKNLPVVGSLNTLPVVGNLLSGSQGAQKNAGGLPIVGKLLSGGQEKREAEPLLDSLPIVGDLGKNLPVVGSLSNGNLPVVGSLTSGNLPVVGSLLFGGQKKQQDTPVVSKVCQS